MFIIGVNYNIKLLNGLIRGVVYLDAKILAKQIFRLWENGDIHNRLSRKLAKFSHWVLLMLLA